MGRPPRNILGEKFGKLVAIKYNGNSMWECKCECGNTKNVKITDLELGKTKSCGTCNKIIYLKDNLTGIKVGELTVESYNPDIHKWKCKCSCGNETYATTSELKYARKKSCGHLMRTARFVDITGQKFNEWTVLKYAGDRKWLCRCSCGTEKEVWAKFLKSGQSRSCGHSSLHDKIGQKFGDLTLIKRIDDTNWECLCSCGNTTTVNGSNLISGRTTSCGCKSASNSKYSKEDIIDIINKLTQEYNRKPFVYELVPLLDVVESTVYNYITKYDLSDKVNHSAGSRYEEIILNIIKNNYTGKILLHDRSILNGDELDIYLPDKNIAFEINGDYWHCELYKDAKYHQNKTLRALQNNIRLIHIFEHEIINSETLNKLENIIKSALSDGIKIYGRETKIRAVSYQRASEFLNKYHLQGECRAGYYYGCYYNSELIGIAEFGVSRFSSYADSELIRLCWKPEYNVVGGLNKFISRFLDDTGLRSIITYADISKFTGMGYIQAGFNKIDKDFITQPGYLWVNIDTKDIMTRGKTQVAKLKQIYGDTYGSTENEIMHNLGYYKIYNSGNAVFIYNATKWTIRYDK